MSRYQNGVNGFPNGGSARSSPFEEAENAQQSQLRSGRDRRAGGYGGFNVEDLHFSQQDRPRQPRGGPSEPNGGHSYRFLDGREREGSYSRSRERGGRDVSSARTYGSGPGGRQIEDVLEHINSDWEVVTKDDCVPVYFGLQLMDHSSLGRGGDYQDFQKTNRQLQKALKTIVNEHHQGFNSSIGTFHQIQASIQTSQNRVRALKEAVQNAQSHLMVTSPELVGLGLSSRSYDEMLQHLGLIEKLQAVPEQLDARISEKRFLSAVDTLQDALRMLRKSEMEPIGALSDLQTYFNNQEASLIDILVEELHDHVYLKSIYCQDRWKPHKANTTSSEATEDGSNTLPNTWGRPLYRFLETLETSEVLQDSAGKNPESNSFEFMHVVIESLSKLGRLEFAVECLNQRLPVELFAVVDRTNREVELRHPSAVRNKHDLRKPKLLGPTGDGSRKTVLDDLLWTLFSKFEAIAESHRAVHDVIIGIADREGLRNRKILGSGFSEMWKLFQSAMRSLLHDYLATDGAPGDHQGNAPANNTNVFYKGPRDRNKRVFKLIDIDKKSSDLMSEQDDVDSIMKASVPGLISKSQRKSLLNPAEDSNQAPTSTHKLLVDPDVSNIGLLLPPSLVFLQRLRDIIPPESEIASSTLTSFLDDFLINVFLPQLEETVTEHCTRAISDLNAFLQDPDWSKHGDRPIFQGTVIFFSHIEAFCRLMASVPADQVFTQLILTQIVAYYDRCCEWYNRVVSHPPSQAQGDIRLKPAASLAESGDIHDVVQSLQNGSPPKDNSDSPITHEINLLLNSTSTSPLQPTDIISDRRSVSALCLLHNSLIWLSTKLSSLKNPLKSSQSKPTSHTRRWTQLTLHSTTPPPATLPLTSETLTPFTNLLSSLHALANTALRTLHLDIRLGILHILSTRLIPGPYLLSAPTDPDPVVLSLNNDLLSSDDTITSILAPSSRKFVLTMGLAHLIDTALVRLSSSIKAMNLLGCARMQLSILILQQNLKDIVAGRGGVVESTNAANNHNDNQDDDATLSKSTRYFNLFERGAEEIVKEARESGFSMEELKVLVRLWYSEGMGSSAREVSAKARKEMGERELGLSEVMWDA